MSLICETIVSEEELSQTQTNAEELDEELDFEEEMAPEEAKEAPDTDDRDEGELEDDDDLEEGEVKDDDPSLDASLAGKKRVLAPEGPQQQQRGQTNSICRFFGRGQCTWGNNCRFIHPTGGTQQNNKRMTKGLPPPLPPPPMPQMPPMRRQGGQQREFGYQGNQEGGGGGESAWERGLKQAKEMIVRASRRKEEELDFEDKRFNLSVEVGSRDSSPRDERHSVDEEEYERRRRLAFESAPWNNEEPVGAKMRQAEVYRDPWRRSKTPPGGVKVGGVRGRVGVTGRAKRSHSMSSISGSEGSESESEFSGSEDSFSDSSSSQSRQKTRYNRTDIKDNNNVQKQRAERVERTERQPMLQKKEDDCVQVYDSWSESLSDSSSDSYYSSEESNNQKKEETKETQKRVKKTTGGEERTKRQKTAANTDQKPKKAPIKMTFLKKQSNLSNKSVVKEKNATEGDIQMSPHHVTRPLSPSHSPLSPLHEENVNSRTPSPPNPLQNALQSSSGSSGSSKHEKSLLATVSRREELLQQLKAVEDAIARKRSKIN